MATIQRHSSALGMVKPIQMEDRVTRWRTEFEGEIMTSIPDHLWSLQFDPSGRLVHCFHSPVVEQITDEGLEKQVQARVPLRTLPAYATTLRSITSGRGNYSMEPEGYQAVPREIAEKIED